MNGLQVCLSNVPLDKKDFNPINYINELFPNEQVWMHALYVCVCGVCAACVRRVCGVCAACVRAHAQVHFIHEFNYDQHQTTIAVYPDNT